MSCKKWRGQLKQIIVDRYYSTKYYYYCVLLL